MSALTYTHALKRSCHHANCEANNVHLLAVFSMRCFRSSTFLITLLVDMLLDCAQFPLVFRVEVGAVKDGHIFEGMNAGDALSISRTVSRMLGVHYPGALFSWKKMNASTRHASLVADAMAVAYHDSKSHRFLTFGSTKMIPVNQRH